MMKRITLSLLASASLWAGACAAEQSDTPETVGDVVTQTVVVGAPQFDAPDSAWRDLDPENALYIDTDYGRIIVELFPEIAPLHVAQIKALADSRFYDFITFHRVIEDFMNQTGDPKGDGTGGSELPDIAPEFTFRRSTDMGFTLVGSQPINPKSPSQGEIGVGFYKSLQIASQPSSQAFMTKDGKVAAHGLHCKGVTSMARSQSPASANSQFFLMRGTSPWLDTQYSIWGATVWGRENLEKFKVGTIGEDPSFVPDKMNTVRLASELPESEQTDVQVLKTDSQAFKDYLKTLQKADGSYPDICDINVPSRVKK